MKPSLSFLKLALTGSSVRVSPDKYQWLTDNAPAYFTHRQSLILAYIRGKLALNPDVQYERTLRRNLRVSEEDFDVVNNYVKVALK